MTDNNHHFHVDSECRQDEGTEVSVTMTTSDAKFEFEMVPGTKTSNFVADIFRSAEGISLLFSLFIAQFIPGVVKCNLISFVLDYVRLLGKKDKCIKTFY